MSEKEKQMLRANIKLVDEKEELLRDIKTLIAFIKGRFIKEDVKEIIEYYEKKQFSRDYKRKNL